MGDVSNPRARRSARANLPDAGVRCCTRALINRVIRPEREAALQSDPFTNHLWSEPGGPVLPVSSPTGSLVVRLA
jgi:hypothetical protein